MATKEKLLHYLEENRGKPVSGQALADGLGVSRAAIWKAAKRLEAEGHRITASTNRGYQLEETSDVLTPQGIRRGLASAYRDAQILVERCVGSTNTQLKKLAADGCPGRTVLAAEEQTGGRGRMGRPFYSPANTGLYMSVLLRPGIPVSELAVMTIAAASAVCEAIEALAACRTGIKWVNDIYVRQRKVCGILTEAVSDFESGLAECVVVGIGVNVSTPPGTFPAELRDIAGSLLPERVTRTALAAEILNRFFAYADALADKGFLEPYRSRSLAVGKRVRFCQNGDWREGTATGIDGGGRLVVWTGREELALRAGEIELLEAVG